MTNIALNSTVHYAVDLSKVMKKIIMLGRVAALANDIEQRVSTHGAAYFSRSRFMNPTRDRIYSIMNDTSYEDDDNDDSLLRDGAASNPDEDDSPFVIDVQEKSPVTGQLTDEQKLKIARLLGAWEEPMKNSHVEVGLFVLYLASHYYLDSELSPSSCSG